MAGLPNYFEIQARKLKNQAKSAYEKKKKEFKGILGRQHAPENQFIAENLRGYYNGHNKTIQKNFRFNVEFYFSDAPLENFTGYFPVIQPWHIKSVSFPSSNKFRMESMKIGPYHYGVPIMDTAGYDIVITFEEDDVGTIFNFIHACQALIIGGTNEDDTLFINVSNGNYAPQSLNRFSQIIINIYNDTGDIVKTISFRDCFFMDASQVDLSYDGAEAIKYTVTFHSDLMEHLPGNTIAVAQPL